MVLPRQAPASGRVNLLTVGRSRRSGTVPPIDDVGGDFLVVSYYVPRSVLEFHVSVGQDCPMLVSVLTEKVPWGPESLTWRSKPATSEESTMAELLRTISSRFRSFLSIENAVKHHGPRVHEILDQKYNPLLPEELKIDFLSHMRAIVEILRHMRDRLLELESALVSERSGDTPTRLSRDEAAAGLSSVMLGARDSFEGVYNPVTVEAYGFPRFIGTTHVELMRQGDHLTAKLLNPDRPFPSPRFAGGLSIDAMAQSVADKTAALRESLGDAGKGTKIAEAAVVDKDRATEFFDLVETWGARILVSYFILAGERRLAARIRPRPSRGRGGEPGENGEVDGGDGEGASDEAGSGGSDPAKDDERQGDPGGEGEAEEEPEPAG